MRENVGAHLGRDGERQLSAGTTGDLADLLDAARQSRDGLLRVWTECVACICEPHAAAAPDEQWLANLALEGLEPRGQRGLGYPQRFGGVADVAVPRDLKETLDLGKLHRRCMIDDRYLWLRK